MVQMHTGASLAGASLSAPAIRPGLINPATRFRKLLPYIGTALVVVIAAAGYATMKGMAASRDWLARTFQVKSELADLELDRALLRGYENGSEVTADAQADLQSTAEAIEQSLARLKQLTLDDSVQQERLGQLEPITEQHIKEIQSEAAGGINPAGNPGRSSAITAKPNAEIDAGITRIIGEINAQETQLLRIHQAAWDRQFRRNIAVLALAVGACLLLLFANMHLLRADVRSSRVATEHIRESADSYRALSARIIGLQDAERRRIGRELHDSVGQSLAAVQMNLNQLATAGNAQRGPLVAESSELVRRTSQEVRTISQLLHPPLLDVVGFVAAAQNYMTQFARRSGIEMKVNLPEDLRLPSKEAEMVLFRVLQESLTNVHRHAQASTVDVWLARHGREVVLTIQDNGKGLPAGVIESFEAGMASGVGLGGMRERLAEFGGRLELETSHSGTIMRASVPE